MTSQQAMDREKYLKVKIVGKWKTVFLKRPMFSIDSGYGKPRYIDVPAKNMAQYFAYNIGDMIEVLFQKDEDGLWYPSLK